MLKSDIFRVVRTGRPPSEITMDSSGNLVLRDGFKNVTLSNLVAVGPQDKVFIVGSGPGADYATVQEAVDAVTTTPAIIQVLPGTYTESVRISKTGIHLMSPGGAVVRSPGFDPALLVQAQGSSVPRSLRVSGLTFENTVSSSDCVKVVGTTTNGVGSDGILFESCRFRGAVSGCHFRGYVVGSLVFDSCEADTGDLTCKFLLTGVQNLYLTDSIISYLQVLYDSGSSVIGPMGVCDILSSRLGQAFVDAFGSVNIQGVRMSDTSSFYLRSKSLSLTAKVFNSSLGDVSLEGPGDTWISHCRVRNFSSVSGTVRVDKCCFSGSLLGGGGDVDFDEDHGRVDFSSDSSVSAEFSNPRPSTDYSVFVSTDIPSLTTTKTTAGISFSTPEPASGRVDWRVYR